MGTKTCGCGALITFARHWQTGKWHPIDDEATLDGNIEFTDRGAYRILSGQALEDARSRGQKLHTSHFATCPNRRKYRR